jgi:ribonucrease Y
MPPPLLHFRMPIQKAGNDAALEANIRGLHPKVIEAMGKLHFRTSYGQNVLRHSIEVAYLCQIIADQLGLDGAVARRCGFLHDIGKAMDHEMEGGHPQIGMEFVRKYGEKAPAVLNAIAGHHGDVEPTTPYTPIVMGPPTTQSSARNLDYAACSYVVIRFPQCLHCLRRQMRRPRTG